MSESIANRLGLLEQKIHWLMTNMRMKAVVMSGLLGPDGQPQGQVVEGTMLDMFTMATNPNSPQGHILAQALAKVNEANAPTEDAPALVRN